MVSQIDPRSRENPEAAMVHAKAQPYLPNYSNQGWVQQWAYPDEPAPKDEKLNEEREAKARGGQVPAPHSDDRGAFDSAAHRDFMRSLG